MFTNRSITAASNRRSRRSIRTKVAAAVAAVGVIAGVAFGAAPAQAATPAYGNVGACFTQYFLGAPGALSFRNVTLEANLGGYWYPVSTYYTNLAGCIPNIAVVAGYTWRFRVSLQEGSYTYAGTSKYATVASGYFYDLGPVGVLVTKRGL